MTATTTANASAPANGEPAVPSHEVGMMFVHEYYTFLNKEPSRLHCFYNKQSTMSHGIQGDEPHVSHGQQDIHAKILDLDFEDCKVLVRTVDSQSSLNGGIMIQVLGEMSNKGGPSQKFVQTFFLAEQPKGYYVLNDIFRYLKDDVELELEAIADEPEVEKETESLAPAEASTASPAYAAVDDSTSADVTPVAEAAPVEEVALVEVVVLVEEAKVEAVEEQKPAAEEKKPAEKKTEHKKHEKKSDKKDSKKEELKDVKKDAEVAEKPSTPEPTKKAESSQSQAEAPAVAVATAAPVATPAPVPSEPPKPKTWANLAANNSNQWGSNVASAAKGASINVAQPTLTPAPKPQTPQPSPAQVQNKPQGQRPNNGREDVLGIYVKNITEKMSVEQLREAFGKFGTVKNFELTPKKNCAYVDFDSAEAAQAALKQNRVSIGSEIVLAEERRPRNGFQNGGRPFHYQNGNGPNGHQGPQGGHRGGRPSRGGFQDRKPIQRPEKAAPTVAVN